jgi:hypothetical protein
VARIVLYDRWMTMLGGVCGKSGPRRREKGDIMMMYAHHLSACWKKRANSGPTGWWAPFYGRRGERPDACAGASYDQVSLAHHQCAARLRQRQTL